MTAYLIHTDKDGYMAHQEDHPHIKGYGATKKQALENAKKAYDRR